MAATRPKIGLVGTWQRDNVAGALRTAGYEVSEVDGAAASALAILGDSLSAAPLATLSAEERRRSVLVVPSDLLADDGCFGLDVGDVIAWPAPAAELRARIERVLRQASRWATLERELENVERRHRFIHDHAPAMVHSVDAKGNLLSVSDGWLAALGYTREEVIGRWSIDFLAESSRAHAQVELGRFLQQGSSDSVELTLVRKDGSTMDVHLASVLERDADGSPLRSFAILTDLGAGRRAAHELSVMTDDQRRLQTELADAHELLNRLLDAIPDPVFVKDRQHRWILINPSYCQFMGQPREALLGRSDFDFFPRQEAAEFWEKDELVFSTGETNENEESFTDASGKRHVIATKKAAFERPDGSAVLVGVIRDLTAHRRLEAAVRLSERMASVGTLAAGVAHEMNTPLAYILGNLEAGVDSIELLRAGGTIDLDDLVDSMRESIDGTKRLRAIVADMRRFSGPEDEKRTAVDVASVFDVAARMLSHQIRQRGKLVVELEPGLPPVEATEGRLGQVLINLLMNAMQALRATGRENNVVTLLARQEGATIVIEVRDNGVGIPPETLARIFDPFFTTKPIGVGTGLGLSLCHGIVTSLGGHIVAESSPAGTTMRVTLPVSTREPPPALSPRAPVTSTNRRRSVLVIDDDEGVASAVRRILRRDFDVSIALGGEEALRLIDKAEFDLVLCDLMMPVMTGAELYEHLKAGPRDVTDRFVFLTGGAFTAETQAFLDRTTNRLIRKPFEMAELRRVVQAAIDDRESGERDSV